MNILMLTNTYLPHMGGVARSVAAFAEEYRRRGHRVLIVAPEFENRPAEETDVIRMPAIQNFNGSDFSVRLPVPGMLTPALDAFQPQIVHSHHPFLLGDTAIRIAAARNLPLVFTHHTMYEQYTHYVPLESALLARFVIDLTTSYTNLCDAVVAPSESVAAVLAHRGVLTPIEVIPTGVDTEHFAKGEGAAFRQELGIPADAFVVGHLGRLAPEKNLPFLAQAVAAFLKRNRKAHFLVVGSGPSEQVVRDMFRGPRFRSRVHMPGPCQGARLVNAYHAMDVFAFASQSETQGMVLTEAMAAGVPVVAVDASGAREVVVDGQNGRLLPSQNQRSFSAALAWVAERPPPARQALRERARQTAVEFSMPRTADKALKLYESLLAHAAREKQTNDSPWESALRVVEAEWELWSNVAQAAGVSLESPHVFRIPVLGTALRGWQLVRRWFNRSEWGARLLGLPPSTARAERGLILVQIDGLSRTQLERALKKRRMPFLRKLLSREDYALHTHYSGLPSTTGAVQGELFYGVKTAVPAFGFALREPAQMVTMLDPQVASHVQRQVARGRVGLLEGGSAFCNVYSGGAAEPHFCAAAIGWGDLLRYANPLGVLVFLAWNAWSLVRTCGLACLEILLALIDCFRGIIEGHDLWKELKFIPSRVGVCVLMRELTTIAAAMDAARGMPVIHLNYLGYDEQSHRRGPDSAFAHWSLKGLDRSIARVWHAARHSWRDYAVWIYSDHGQEHVRPYELVAGRTISEAVNEVVHGFLEKPTVTAFQAGRGAQNRRLNYLGGRLPQRLANQGSVATPPVQAEQILCTAQGPVGHVYLPLPLSDDDLQEVCRRLVQQAQVPLTLMVKGPDAARACTSAGEFELPRDAAQVLGPDHPFLNEAAHDLVRLCHHPQAGQVVILGWSHGSRPLSFAYENGAHGGTGPEETRGFAVLPTDTAVPETERDFLRPLDLRRAGLDLLGRGDSRLRRRPSAARETLRIVTYNVHSCVGLDGKLSASRIARVLAQCDADIVALQELDFRRPRSRHMDQAHEIARDLEMQFHFHPALSVEEERYGDAILTRLPMRVVRASALPGVGLRPGLEPRGAIWVTVEVGGRELQLFNTHLGLSADERGLQVEALLGPDWIGHPDCRGPTVLCGDFNALPGSNTYRRLATHLRDAQRSLNGHRPRKTWISAYPLGRIDHVFVGPGVEVVNVQVPASHLARTASDHLPVMVELRFTGPSPPRSD